MKKERIYKMIYGVRIFLSNSVHKIISVDYHKFESIFTIVVYDRYLHVKSVIKIETVK